MPDESDGVEYTYLTADALISKGPVILLATILLVSTTGGDVTIYDGQDATNGKKVNVHEGTANECNSVQYGPGVLLRSGLFVDVGSNVTGICVVWKRALGA